MPRANTFVKIHTDKGGEHDDESHIRKKTGIRPEKILKCYFVDYFFRS